jgi:hypothetical protein
MEKKPRSYEAPKLNCEKQQQHQKKKTRPHTKRSRDDLGSELALRVQGFGNLRTFPVGHAGKEVFRPLLHFLFGELFLRVPTPIRDVHGMCQILSHVSLSPIQGEVELHGGFDFGWLTVEQIRFVLPLLHCFDGRVGE